MAAPDGVVCAVAVNNEAAENAHLPPQPRHQRASVRGATRSTSGSRRAGVAGVFIAGAIGHGANVPIETDNDAAQGAGALSPREQVSFTG